MSDDDDTNGTVECILEGVTYSAEFDVYNGDLFLHIEDHKTIRAKPLPGRLNEDSALFFLKQFAMSKSVE
jgi:hypothetical protein